MTKPLISIISVLYKKENEVNFFLDALYKQDFKGRYEVILVNDLSPDNSVQVVKDFERWRLDSLKSKIRMTIKIIENKKNIGNCGCRNLGIKAASSNIFIVVDSDCMLNRSFLSYHYQAHMKGDCDVAIGPINIETGNQNPLSVLTSHEANLEKTILENNPQDSTNIDSFVNCITRNFSISKAFVKRIGIPLFDENFSYSEKPDSGFGWEDVEMGYRVYSSGGRIKYLPLTFSIHVSHDSSINNKFKPIKSLKNFSLLLKKHPEIIFVARSWACNTYNAIINWVTSEGHHLDKLKDYLYLDRLFNRYKLAPISIKKNRPLKILTYRWHVPHQYELYKNSHDYTLVTGAGTGLCNAWELSKRPRPSNLKFVDYREINENDYDLAILHFDENVLHPEICNHKVPLDWGETFKWFVNNISLPKVAICHGTPQFYGQYDINYNKKNLGIVRDDFKKELVDFLSDTFVICNSYQANFEWGFNKSKTIWHGFAPHEYPKGEHKLGIITMDKNALINRPHYNGLFIYEEVQKKLDSGLKIKTLEVPDPPLTYMKDTVEWAVSKYQNYVNEINNYSIYLNSTARSPMPRSRGEAMMCGLITVSLKNHDVEMFVKNGVNGFYASTPEELAEQINWLNKHPKAKLKIADASRATALDIFNQDRYLSEWSDILNSLLI
jgi:GT2 family glycosyltransferase